jgi:CMP-N,N'-diacetyllegionaminic acid synthase
VKKSIALIPARSGSKRINNKNLRLLGGHPLIAYTISLAFESELFSKVVVSSDSDLILEASSAYGDVTQVKRPVKYALDSSPDIEWISHVVEYLAIDQSEYEYLTILRPSNPLRKAVNLKKAHQYFLNSVGFDSLRAMQVVRQHPGKVWQLDEKTSLATPLLDKDIFGTPWHSSPTNFLPEYYYQDASLEITTVANVKNSNSLAGGRVLGWKSDSIEGFDLNYEEDWQYLIYLIDNDKVKLNNIRKKEK